MSLCGGLNNCNPTDEQFNEHLITYEQFVNDPVIFKNPNLMFRINGQMYHWDVACPAILSIALFRKSLPKVIIRNFSASPAYMVVDVVSSDLQFFPSYDATCT